MICWFQQSMKFLCGIQRIGSPCYLCEDSCEDHHQNSGVVSELHAVLLTSSELDSSKKRPQNSRIIFSCPIWPQRSKWQHFRCSFTYFTNSCVLKLGCVLFQTLFSVYLAAMLYEITGVDVKHCFHLSSFAFNHSTAQSHKHRKRNANTDDNVAVVHCERKFFQPIKCFSAEYSHPSRKSLSNLPRELTLQFATFPFERMLSNRTLFIP